MNMPAWLDHIVWIFVGIAATLLTKLLMDWLSIGEADLVGVESGPPPAPDLSGGVKDGKLAILVKIRPLIMNKGLKSGYVDKVEVSPAGLTPVPERVDVAFLDRRPLRWREKREIRVEFVAIINPKAFRDSLDTPSVEFRVSLLGVGGKEICWQGIRGYAYRGATRERAIQEGKFTPDRKPSDA